MRVHGLFLPGRNRLCFASANLFLAGRSRLRHGESIPRTNLLLIFIISFAANLFLGTVSSYEKYISL